ncbi:MAG: hypothetical protein IKE23_01465 [Exiguobacterium sp.]|nr:hypothetical protein [Exiguobacterium sp.]
MASDKYLDYPGLTRVIGHTDAVYGASISIASRTITLTSRDNTTLASVTVPDTVIPVATQSADGLMSSGDKTKLDGIYAGATAVASSDNGYISINGVKTLVYAPAAQTALASGLWKITTNAEGFVTAGTAVVKSDITALGIPAQDTTYSVATAASDGLMSSSDFSKLGGIESGAQVNVLEAVSVNGSPLVITSKGVNIDLTPYALKTDIAAVYKYKGSVATYDDLPTTGQEVGDVWNVINDDASHGIEAGENVVWTGSEWDDLGGSFAITPITNAQIDALFA